MPKPQRIRAATSKGMVKTLVGLPKVMLRQLAVVTRKTGMVRSEIVRQAVAEWLGKHHDSA